VARKKIKYRLLNFFFTLIVLEAGINVSDLFVARRKNRNAISTFFNLDCIDADMPGNGPSKSKGRMEPQPADLYLSTFYEFLKKKKYLL
jgi:hypothetical protein